MKKVHYPSAMPIYIAAAVWLLAGILWPKALLGIGGLIVTAALSAGAGFLSRRFFPGRTVEVEEKIVTGDRQLDQDIAEGRARLEALRKANAAIEDAEITRNLSRMTAAGDQIFQELGRDPKKYNQVRRFMNYYLPTTEKLLEQYQIMMGTATKGDKIQSAMSRVESSLGMIADAFEKCADNLFSDTELDIDAEIQVLRTMLAGDSLIGQDSPASPQPQAASQEDDAPRGQVLGGH